MVFYITVNYSVKQGTRYPNLEWDNRLLKLPGSGHPVCAVGPIGIHKRSLSGTTCVNLACPIAESRHAGYVLLLFFYLLIFSDSHQTNYLKIYWTDRRQIFRVSRTTAVNDQSKINFTIHQRTLPWQPHFLVLVHWCRWTQAAGGAAGRANVGL